MKVEKIEVCIKIDVPLGGLQMHEIQVKFSASVGGEEDYAAIERWLYWQATQLAEQNAQEFLARRENQGGQHG